MRLEQWKMTFRERRALRRVHFAPDDFDNDRTDRATMIGALVVLVLFMGGLWLLAR